MRRVALSFALLLVTTLLAPALLAPVAASPQPSPICRFCGPAFADAAESQGVNVTVTNSTVEVRVHEDGTATWVVKNRLGRGADQFTESDRRLDRAAKWLLEERWGLPESATFVGAQMDDGVAVLTYRDPDAATRHAGLLVVDYLHDEGYEPWYHVNAERFTIRGPDGSVVTNDPESGRVGDETGTAGTVTWRGESTREVYASSDLEGSPYVVFGPDRSLATQARTTLALALATLPIVARSAQTYLLWQTLLFAAGLAIVASILRSRRPSGSVGRWATALAVLGALGALAPAIATGPQWVLGPPLFGVGFGLLALSPRTRHRLQTPRQQALAAAGVLVATFVALVAIHATVSESWRQVPETALRSTALAFPLAAMLPVGSAFDASRGTLVRWYTLAVVAFAATPVAMVNFADPPSGFGSGLFAVLLFVLAVLAPIVGGVVLALGRSLATAGQSVDSRPQ